MGLTEQDWIARSAQAISTYPIEYVERFIERWVDHEKYLREIIELGKPECLDFLDKILLLL